MSRKPVVPLGLKLLLLFVGVPLLELYILLQLTQATSLLFTLLLVFGSGALGAAMARHQGMRVWIEANTELRSGRFPADSLIDGIVILVGAALLLTPGVLTDLVGFSTLFPQTRKLWRLLAKAYFGARVISSMRSGPAGGFHFSNISPGAPPPPAEDAEGGEVLTAAREEDAPHHSPFEDTSPFAKNRR